MSRPLTCPSCKLLNPPGAMWCECGYDFQTRQLSIKQSSAHRLASEKRKPAATAGVYSLAVLLLAVGFLCQYAADAITRQQRVASTLTSPSAHRSLIGVPQAEAAARAAFNDATTHGLIAFFFAGILLGISFLGWSRWFKGRSGGIITFVGFTVFAVGLTGLLSTIAIALLFPYT
jgi:hypothetical protein